MKDLLNSIEKKYQDLGQDPKTYLKGLLQAKPLNYWDYIQVETLLSLQRPRTEFKDEEIFIMYHQVIELFQKMLLHEVKQLQEAEEVIEKVWIEKMGRIDRYVEMLINSFDIMRYGMDYDDYNIFRDTLAPASGFQSVQFRLVELHCTPLVNLVNEKGKKRLPENPSFEDYFENIYWQDAGRNHQTGEKTLTLRQFEEKYGNELKALARRMQGNTLYDKFKKLPNPSKELTDKLLKFDVAYNVTWPMVHLNTAAHYLDSKGETKAATGGSEWKKYLHPDHQQRRFFPDLWEINS